MDKLVDALYSRFLLRDLFGKIVPGSIALLALQPLSDTLFPEWGLNLESAAQTAIRAGLAWLLAFALQSLGEMTQLLRYYPQRYSGYEARYGVRIRFDRQASEPEKQQVERLLVIKEATGIGSLSVFLVATNQFLSGLTSIRSSGPTGRHLLVSLLSVGFGLLLLKAHRAHADRQYNYMDVVLGTAAGPRAA